MTRKKISALVVSFIAAAGFLLGVFFLFFIIDSVEAILSRAQVPQGTVNLVMVLLIAAWAATTFVVTYLFYKGITKDENFQKFSVFLIALLFFLSSGTFYVLSSTENNLMVAIKGTVTASATGFTYGPYPDEAVMERLKQEGFAGIITLLSPTIPFEKILLEKEVENGIKIGFNVYSFPMLPWLSDNREPIAEILNLVTTNKGKYYVHCYLGKHRTNLVKKALEAQFGGGNEQEAFNYPAKLERGPLYYSRDKKVILGPYPTDEEWNTFIPNAEIREVISFLDPDVKENLPWMNKEVEVAKNLSLNYRSIPVKKSGSAYEGVSELIAYIQSKKGPVYIHGFLLDDKAQEIKNQLENSDLVVTSIPVMSSP